VSPDAPARIRALAAQTWADAIGDVGDARMAQFAKTLADLKRNLIDAEPAAAGAGGPGDTGTTHKPGLSPWFFVGGAIATAGLGAATIWSGLDVLSAHDEYKKNPTSEAYNDGRSKELRTNVLIGATSVVGAATAVIAIFTDWGGKHGETAQTGIHATACVTGSSAAIVVGGAY